MFNSPFLINNDPKTKIARHVLFWMFWGLYFGFAHAAQPFNPKMAYFSNLPFTIIESMLLLIPHVFLVYTMIIFVLPFFTKPGNHFFEAFVVTIILFFIAIQITLFMVGKFNPWFLRMVLPEKYLRNTGRPPEVTHYMGLLIVLKGALSGVGLALGFKFLKQWIQNERRNLKLQKENSEAQLKILTAQVHPHFLFNTLNNIYSLTQTTSPLGASMVMGMSDLLRYMLYEGSKTRVPLKRELQLIEEYIRLEKIRYGNKLDLHMSVPIDVKDFQIAPLLLLPFVENSFKHGASNILESPWINLEVVIEENSLRLKMMNGKCPQPEFANPGIGIKNVKQRLELLYPRKHRLEIVDEADVYVVNLVVELESAQDQIITSYSQPTIATYA